VVRAVKWRGRDRWLGPLLAGATLLVALPNLLLDHSPPMILLVLVGPLLSCVRLGVRCTLLLCCWSAALGLAMGMVNTTMTPFVFGVRYGGLLAGCAVAHYAARQRCTLQSALAEAREVTRVTQEAILRPISRNLAGTHVCTRYHCAARESVVGGDLYDVALTPYGLRLLVGDVRGHGLEALRLTAATVAGFRDLAHTASDLPGLTLALNDRIGPELGPEDFVTAVLAEFAPGEVRLVNCGHPAPLRAGRRIEFLEPFAPTTPLGLGPDPRQYRVGFQPGDRLLVYTDGLTEARSADGTLFPLLAEATRALCQPLPDDVLRSLHDRVLLHTGGRPADDLALVLCQSAEALVPLLPR